MPLVVLNAFDGETPPAAQGAVARPGWLSDGQGRRLRYLRLSVTDRCDLRCAYCMPEEGVAASPRSDLLSFEEIARVVRVFRRLGVETVRLTGGEPLLRRGLADLVAMIRDEGIEDIALTTNATALAHQARALRSAGVRRLNISLDSVDPETFGRMTRGGDLSRVVGGIDAAAEVGFSGTKTNTVVVRGQNDDQLASIVEWCWARELTPRFIELMPLGTTGLDASEHLVSVSEMKARLGPVLAPGVVDYPLHRGPAGYLDGRDGRGRVGFIGAMTQNFCERCNRVRITARGEIRACLASPAGLALRPLLQSSSDDGLLKIVEESLLGKRDGHRFEHEGESHGGVAMSAVGG